MPHSGRSSATLQMLTEPVRRPLQGGFPAEADGNAAAPGGKASSYRGHENRRGQSTEVSGVTPRGRKGGCPRLVLGHMVGPEPTADFSAPSSTWGPSTDSRLLFRGSWRDSTGLGGEDTDILEMDLFRPGVQARLLKP